MTITNWSASLFTADLSRRVDVTARLLDFKGVVRDLAAGEWTATLSAPSMADLLGIWPTASDAPMLGFAVQVPGQVVMSGAINTVTRQRTANGDTTLTLDGVDEYAALQTRLVYPQPDDPLPWTTSAYHVVTGRASSAIAELITRHVDDSARSQRILPGLQVFDAIAGDSGTWQFRLGAVADAVAKIATETGLSIKVRRRQDAGLDVFIGAAVNRTNIVLDDTVLGESTLVLSAATATTVIAGGAGEGTARLFAIAGGEVAGAARREVFSDQRNISSQPALQRAADAERAASSASQTFSGTLTNEAADIYLWRRDYDLGDRLTLRVDGSTWPVKISGVNVSIDADGLRLSPILGTKPRHALAQLLRDVGNLSSRLNTLEVS